MSIAGALWSAGEGLADRIISADWTGSVGTSFGEAVLGNMCSFELPSCAAALTGVNTRVLLRVMGRKHAPTLTQSPSVLPQTVDPHSAKEVLSTFFKSLVKRYPIPLVLACKTLLSTRYSVPSCSTSLSLLRHFRMPSVVSASLAVPTSTASLPPLLLLCDPCLEICDPCLESLRAATSAPSCKQMRATHDANCLKVLLRIPRPPGKVPK
mmetsp:Transcript_125043/g.365206  ORF Transcript_125043/g.365206 Transcript_125043/m.365206 type:complete len:210 (+) Transcript_125043:534-1163(+)